VTIVWPSILALRCVQVILCALLLSMIASTVSFVRIPVAEVEAWPERPVTIRAQQPIEYFAPITQRNLFRYAAGAPLAALGPLPQTKLDVELIGTLLAGHAQGGNASGSMALVRDARQQVSAVREGETLPGSETRVVGIEHRRIVIEHRGALEVVMLESELAEERVHAVKRALGINVVPPPAPVVRIEPAAGAPGETGILDALRAAATNVPPAPKATATPPTP
jgi:type II secretory pathway component PulC